MTENRSQLERSEDESGRQERKSRRLLWLGGAGIAALLAAVVYVNLGPSRALRISKETTYITEPLKSDGQQVDYFAAIRQAKRPENAATDENGYRLIVRHLGKGGMNAWPGQFALICEELALDVRSLRPDMTYQEPVEFLDAYVEDPQFDEALFGKLLPVDPALDGESNLSPANPSRDGVLSMLDEKLARPWTVDELPVMADWLEQNGPSLDLVGQAVRQPKFYIPLASPIKKDDLLIVVFFFLEIRRMQPFAWGLSVRANHRIGTGDLDGAIADIVACKRLGRHVGHRPFLDHLLAGAEIERIADTLGIAGSLDHPPTKEQLERLLAEMDKLPPAARVEDKALAERFFGLDFIQAMSHGKTSLDDFSLPNAATLVTKLRIDWNVVARRFNQVVDDSLANGEPSAPKGLPPANAIPLISLRARSEYLGEVIASLFWHSWSDAEEAVRRRQCAEHMQRIVLAMLLYERDHGTLPPAWSADAAGKPLHSWRVLLLPYLGYGELYERIRLDEPWDSPHNRQFHGEAVSVYRCPGNPLAGAGQATYSVVVGPDMPFEAGEGKRLAEFGPLSDDMILVVERTDPVGWMDPTREVAQADAELGIHDQGSGLPRGPGRIGSRHQSSNFALRNGAVRSLPAPIDSELLRNLLRGTNAEKTLDY